MSCTMHSDETGEQFDVGSCAGKSPLHFATITNDTAALESWIQKGEDVNMINMTITPLYLAVMKEHTKVVKTLVKHQCDVNATTVELKQTPLHCACSRGMLDIVGILIESHALLDVQDSYGATPLFLATQYGKTQIVQLLITSGANLNITDHKGLSPLAIATLNGRVDITRLLLQNHADIDKPDKNGDTPLLHAVKTGQRQICQILVQARASVNVKNKEGDYPIIIASMHGNGAIIDILIAGGCDVNVISAKFETPVFLTVQRQHLKALQKLIEASADVRAAHHKKRTPLIEAMHHTKPKAAVIQELVAAGADVDDTCECHEVPLHSLISKCNGCSVAYLKQSDCKCGHILPSKLKEMKEFCKYLYRGLKDGDQPCSLKGCCRKAIKRSVGGVQYKKKIQSLHLPASLQSYLLYENLPVIPQEEVQQSAPIHITI